MGASPLRSGLPRPYGLHGLALSTGMGVDDHPTHNGSLPDPQWVTRPRRAGDDMRHIARDAPEVKGRPGCPERPVVMCCVVLCCGVL